MARFPDYRVAEQQKVQAAIGARDGLDNGVDRRAKARREAREAKRAADYEASGFDPAAAEKAAKRRLGIEIARKLHGDGSSTAVSTSARKRPGRRRGRR